MSLNVSLQKTRKTLSNLKYKVSFSKEPFMKQGHFDETVFSSPKGMTLISDLYQNSNVLPVLRPGPRGACEVLSVRAGISSVQG